MDNLEFSYAGTHYSNQMTSFHQHNGTELVLVTEGSCKNRFIFNDVLLEEGDLIIIPPEEKHRQIDIGWTKTFYIVFENESDFFNSSLRVISTKDDQFIKTWFEHMFYLYQEKSIDQCCIFLTLILTHLNFLEKKTKNEIHLPYALSKAVRFINTHYSESLEVSKIAKQFGMSCSYFNAQFNHYLNVSPSEYIKKIRMSHARQLLRNSRLQILEVANLCGYQHSAYFCKLFHRIHNITPKEYRNNQAMEYDLSHIIK